MKRTRRTLGQSSAAVQAIAQAIATAEGFYSSATALPARANNPGDLELGDIGNGTIAGKTIYATVQDGWNALYNQVAAMLDGASAFYNAGMSISQVAQIYTGGDAAASWATAVAQQLGVTVDNTLQDVENLLAGGNPFSDGGPVSPTGSVGGLGVAAVIIGLGIALLLF